MKPSLRFLAVFAFAAVAAAEPPAHDPGRLERSFWLNVSLASPALGYWGADFSAAKRPADDEIANAARLLTGDAAANCLYLIYHRELPRGFLRVAQGVSAGSGTGAHARPAHV